MSELTMRQYFVQLVREQMRQDKRIWLLVGDLGYKVWDEVRAEFPDRFLNVGAAEQALVGAGIGLAMQGKIPLVYSITTFLLYRPFELIRNYIHYESIPVKLIGIGRDDDYLDHGFTHWAKEDHHVMELWPNITASWPDSNLELEKIVPNMFESGKPWYINLKR